ncbi:MAG: hypothetical protein GQ569_12410, partial [Methylococcaceae bacterium]|nr:hypothetical protein [Methylococcaceae bacterium]
MRDLYLLNFDNNQYGIWEDELLFCDKTRYVSQLPMFPDYIAGICSIEKGHSLTLADLAVCLGYTKEQKQDKAHALLLTEDKNFAGFCVYGDLEQIPVDEKDCHLISDYLKSDVINSCIMFDQAIIPIINIQVLFGRLLNEQYILPKIEACLPDLLAEPINYLKTARLFSCAQQLFACPVEVVDTVIPLFRKIVNLPATPDYIAGMIEHHEQLIPVINLAKWLEIEEQKPARTLLVCILEGHYFGFLVEKDFGEASGELTFRNFPELLQFYCLQHALIIDEKIVPVVDFNLLITSASSDSTNHFPIKPHYYSNASTPLKFGKAAVTVIPISILGVNHAIPKDEVEDILPVVRYQYPLKNYSLVQGMVYYHNEILPIIDLANCFGRRSRVTDDWKMLLIRNGNFRAFVLAEQVSDALILDIDKQQKLPFVLESPVIYGCYSHETNVDLILNIEAMVTHADKSVVTHIFDSYSQRINRSFVETVSESLELGNSFQKLELASGLTRSTFINPQESSITNELAEDNRENVEASNTVASTLVDEETEEKIFDTDDFLEALDEEVAEIYLEAEQEEIFDVDDFLTISEEEVEGIPLATRQEEPEELIAPVEEIEDETFDLGDFLETSEEEVEDIPLEIEQEEESEELITPIEEIAEETFDVDDFLGIQEEEVEGVSLEIEQEEEPEDLIALIAPVEEIEEEKLNAGDSQGTLEKNIEETAAGVELDEE